jgi:hypothetical protein
MAIDARVALAAVILSHAQREDELRVSRGYQQNHQAGLMRNISASFTVVQLVVVGNKRGCAGLVSFQKAS